MHQGLADPLTGTPPITPLVVVVTGASSGIGRATAVLLTRSGARVVLAARSDTALRQAQGECQEGLTLVVPTDVSKAGEVDALIAAAVDRYGRVDAVVHSAAVLAYGLFEDVPPDVFDASIQVTLLGTANVARAALRQFDLQGGGSLVVVGSLLGKIAVPYMSAYVTAKWAIHGFVRCLQIEARQTHPQHRHKPGHAGRGQHARLHPGGHVSRPARPSPTTCQLS